jgi:hypothetical protein
MSFIRLSSGWLRLAIVLGVAWVIIASLLYAGGLGGQGLPDWSSVWATFFPLAPHFLLYESTCVHLPGGKLFDYSCTNHFSPFGLATFVAYPILVLVIVYACISWVASGFGKKQSEQ